MSKQPQCGPTGFAQALQAQAGNCILCNKPLFSEDFTALGGGVTAEHFWPKSLGGTRWWLAHHDCNRDKGDDLPTAKQMGYLRRTLERRNKQ